MKKIFCIIIVINIIFLSGCIYNDIGDSSPSKTKKWLITPEPLTTKVTKDNFIFDFKLGKQKHIVGDTINATVSVTNKTGHSVRILSKDNNSNNDESGKKSAFNMSLIDSKSNILTNSNTKETDAQYSDIFENDEVITIDFNYSIKENIELTYDTYTLEVNFKVILDGSNDFKNATLLSSSMQFYVFSMSAPPNIVITAGKTNIDYKIGYNVWNNCHYDRMGTFQMVMYDKKLKELPLIRSNKEIQIEFKGKIPDSIELRDYVLNEEGDVKYNIKSSIIPIEFKDNKGSFILKPNAEALSSSYSKDYKSGESIRGFLLVCKWDKNCCEYGFIIRNNA